MGTKEKDKGTAVALPEPLVQIDQKLAVLIDGNNIEISVHKMASSPNTMIDFDKFIPKLVGSRKLTRLVYFREGKSISPKLAARLHSHFYGVVRACHKTADIPLTIEAIQLVHKVDTIIILSGDSDYLDLVRYLQSYGIRVEIASIKMSTSAALKDECDFFHDITPSDFYVYAPTTQPDSNPKPPQTSPPPKSPADRELKEGTESPNPKK